MEIWRKSSFSGQNTDCVEVAFAADAVAVRDSKKPEAGRLDVSPRVWASFVRGLTRRSS